MTTHTPGPWKVADVNPHGKAPNRRWLVTPDVAVAKTAANARLIAAAPDLLEACRAALPAMAAHEETGCDCPDSEAARQLRAAIAKAEG